MKRNLFPMIVAVSLVGTSLLAQTSPVFNTPTAPTRGTKPASPTAPGNPPLSATPPVVANVSLRSTVANGGSSIVGFVINGSATHTVLIRAVGPTLAQLGVLDVLDRPMLALYHDRQLLAVNSGWGMAPSMPTGQDGGVPGNATSTGGTTGGTVATTGAGSTGRLADGATFTVRAATTADFAQTGAFGLPARSEDAALVANLPAGAYTVVVTGDASAAVGGTATSGVLATPAFGAGSATFGAARTGSSGTASSVAISGTGTGMTTGTSGIGAPALATPLNPIGNTTIGNTAVGNVSAPNTTVPTPALGFTPPAPRPSLPSFGNATTAPGNDFMAPLGGDVLVEVYFLD